MIAIENVVKEFNLSRKQRKAAGTDARVTRAVDDVSFTCQPGRIFGLLGPNGAGKTTTLRMIATIMQPTSGNITVCGFNSRTQSLEFRKRIGFLTGSTGLYPRLTTDEVIAYFARLYGIEEQVWKKRRDEYYQLLNMGHFASKRIGQLSTGMKQKVSIVRTMIHDPEVVVFDEPTSGLDVITAANIIELIRRCREQGKTVIFSSHIMSEVDLLCDDMAIIHKGKLLFHDTMDAFRQQMQSHSLTQEFIRIIEQSEEVKP
jgi:sodium transport system ATP-binding protein